MNHYPFIHSIQKIGGLFNANQNTNNTTDWTDSVVSATTVSPLSATTEFLFQSVDEFERTEEMKLYNDVVNPLVEFDDDGEQDFCEVFTDLEDLLCLDGCMSPSIQHLLTPDPLTVQPALTSSNVESTVEDEQLYFVVEPDRYSCSDDSTLDHSYTTIRPTAKRKHCVDVLGEDSFDIIEEPKKKNSKYVERRKKNNIASKRSREARKNKFMEMDDKTTELEKANETLRKKITQLEILTKKMKEALVSKLATK